MIGKCLYCGKEFVGRKDKKFCSPQCISLAYNKSHKEEIKRQKHDWYQSVKERERTRSRGWYQRHRDSEIAKNKEYRKLNGELFSWYHDKDRFNGVRKFVLGRDNNRCVLCGIEKKLSIHHIDGTGYHSVVVGRVESSNNDIENLVTMCNSCHHKVHWWERKHKVRFESVEDIVRTMGKLIEAGKQIQR